MVDLIKSLGAGLWYTLFLYGEIIGIYHAFDKHEDPFTSVWFPPVAWYYSAEIWWHDDSRQLRADIKSLVYLFDNYSNETPSYNEDLLYMTKKIADYDSEEREYLKEFAIRFIHYRNSEAEDLHDAVSGFLETGILRWLKSNRTINKLKLLEKYNINDWIPIYNYGDEQESDMSASLEGKTLEDIEIIYTEFVRRENHYFAKTELIFKELFNEELNLNEVSDDNLF